MQQAGRISFPLDSETNQETRSHGDSGLPVGVYFSRSNIFTQGYSPWHWHKETELYFVVEGSVQVSTPAGEYILREMEGCFINANCLHSMRPHECDYALFQSVVFDPFFIASGNTLLVEEKYIYPLLKCRQIQAILIDYDFPWHSYIYERLGTVIFAQRRKIFGYEIIIRNALSEIWLKLLSFSEDEIKNAPKNADLDFERIQIMLEMIHTDYEKNLTLEDIASSANISESACCRCFQRCLKQSPIDYLVEYRIHKAADLLLGTDLPVTGISYRVGFNSTSYFSNRFKQILGMSPREYRTKKKDH